MTRSNDSIDEMQGILLDRDTADRLLAGVIPRDDAPPGYAEVARLVEHLRAAPAPAELADERVAVAAAVRSLRDRAPAPVDVRRWRMRVQSRAKLSAIIVIATLFGTAAMAAANVLPDAAQDGLSHALSHVGITVPHSSADPASDHPSSTGQEISTIATTTDATGVAKGAEVSSAASGGVSQAGQHGGSTSSAAADQGDSAPVTVPNTGGTGTADGASGGADGTGSGTADQTSDGRAAEGSSNGTTAPTTPSQP
jgi:hypothetical protein